VPGDAEAVAALYALYVELRRWDDLVNLIERRLERDLSRDQDIELRFRLAQIQRIELANRERALEYLGQVLERDRITRPAFRSCRSCWKIPRRA